MAVTTNKKSFLLFVFIVMTLVVSLRTYLPAGFFLFSFFSIFIILNFFYLLIVYKVLNLSITRNHPSKIEEDSVMDFDIVVLNKGKLVISNLIIKDHYPFEEGKEAVKTILIDCLPSGSTARTKLKTIFLKRGKYNIGPVFIYLYDFFGLYAFKKTLPIYSEIYVYPKTFFINKLPELNRGISPWFGIETARTSGEFDEYFGIREYKPGDPIKNIHWLSTVRNNKLIVKQYQHQSYFRVSLIFNLEPNRNFGEGRESVIEYMIKIAASLIKYLIEKNISVEIISHSKEFVYIPFNKGREYLEDIMKFLAIAVPESNVSLGEIFQDYSSYISDNSSLICIMLDKDWEYLPYMLPLCKRNVLLVPIILMSHTFIQSFEKKDMLIDAKKKVAQVFNIKPIIVSKGDNLVELFS